MISEGQDKEPILSEEEAREKANMLRAQMGMSPETGKIPEEKPWRHEKEATAEDYRIAMETLDELERLAEEKPELVKKLWQYATISIVGVAMPFSFVLGTLVQKILRPDLDKEMAPEEWLKTWNEIKADVFDDARSKIERLKNAGEEFGRKEE